MKAKLGYSFLFLFVLIASVISHIPASWLIERFMPANNSVEITGVSGTIWQGNAQNVRIHTPQNMPTVSLGEVAWSFNPLSIFLARIDYDVEFGKNSQIQLAGIGSAGMNFSGAYLRDTQLSIPAEQVMSFIELPMPVEVTGQGQLKIENWQMSSNFCVAGQAQLTWSDARVDSIAGSLDVDLVNADIYCREGEASDEQKVIDIVATQQSGDFASTLNMTIDQQQFNYQLDSSLTPTNNFPAMFKQGLDMLAQQDGQGRYIYQMSGKLPL